MTEQKKRSYIIGQAQVVFGGGIEINVGIVGGDTWLSWLHGAQRKL